MSKIIQKNRKQAKVYTTSNDVPSQLNRRGGRGEKNDFVTPFVVFQ